MTMKGVWDDPSGWVCSFTFPPLPHSQDRRVVKTCALQILFNWAAKRTVTAPAAVRWSLDSFQDQVRQHPTTVIAGLDPRVEPEGRLRQPRGKRTGRGPWVPGSSPGMTMKGVWDDPSGWVCSSHFRHLSGGANSS